MITVYVGLGSNLDDPASHISKAFRDLSTLPATKLVAKSSSYITSPVGPKDQLDFVNAVAKLETELPVNILLGCLLEIEQQHGRQRERHWGPRTLDLDILLYGDMKINEETLKIPHPEMVSRYFVLYPIMEIDQNVNVPGHGKVRDLFNQLNVSPPKKV